MKARGYVDFSALLWVGLVIGLLLGGCGYFASSSVFRRLHVEWRQPAE